MSLPSLYELADEFKEALESLTDLDDQSVKDTLESLEGEFKLKTTNVAKYIKNLEHTAEGIKEVESRQHKRRTSIESKIKHLKEYLRYNLEKTNTQKIESSEITITIQNNPHKVVITNEKDIPRDFLETKEVQSIDKTKIKEALKNGENIPGCELVQEKRVSIK